MLATGKLEFSKLSPSDFHGSAVHGTHDVCCDRKEGVLGGKHSFYGNTNFSPPPPPPPPPLFKIVLPPPLYSLYFFFFFFTEISELRRQAAESIQKIASNTKSTKQTVNKLSDADAWGSVANDNSEKQANRKNVQR